MKSRRSLTMAVGTTGLALAFGVGVAVGQNAPAETTGLIISPPTALELGPEIDDVAGRQLRLRVVTFEPGAQIVLHSHKGRPGVAYVLQGTLTEHVEGKGTFERRTGESWTEGKDTNHWAENKSGERAVVLAVDVFKP